MEMKNAIREIINISSVMFKMGFLGVYHGSISAKMENNKFIINKKETIFDRLGESDLILLYDKKDYRWNEASDDSDIHQNIYKNIPDARYIIYAMPPFTISYSLSHDFIMPKDYQGYKNFTKIKIYDPRQFDDWSERAPYEIYKAFNQNSSNIAVIKGYGVYAYGRNTYDIAKNIALLENSSKVLFFEKMANK